MNTLTSLLDEGIPLIAVAFSGDTAAEVIADAENQGLDIAEMRIDHFPSTAVADVLAEIGKFSMLHTIGTIRMAVEGGKWAGSEEQRLQLFRAIIPAVDAVDVELQARSILPQVVEAAHAHGKLVIVSHHNFQQTPALPTLQAVIDEAAAQKADVIKIAAHANNAEDLQRLAELTLANRDKRLIVIAMGADGLASRVFFPALGSKITFAYIGKQTAPGQLPFAELTQLLRQFYPRFEQRKAA